MEHRTIRDGAKAERDLLPAFNELKGLCPKAFKNDGAGGLRVSFVGIAIANNTLIVSLPKGDDSRGDPSNRIPLTEAVRILVRSLIQYEKDEPLEAMADEALSGGERLRVAFKILEDYRVNGLVNRYKSVVRPNASGNVAWQKTISRTTPLCSDSSVVYPTTYARHYVSNSEDPLRRVQEQVVGECLDLLGEIYGMKRPAGLGANPFSCSNKALLSILEKEKAATYSQRELELVTLLAEYLRGSLSQAGDTSPSLFGSLYFEHVWEAACKVVFCDEADLQRIMPQPEWELVHLEHGSASTKAIRQIPDVLARQNNVMYILDAKYYETSVSLPGWPDAVKQIYYQDTLERRLVKRGGELARALCVERTANAFLLPGSVDDECALMGSVHFPSIDDGNRWGYIDAYVVDVWKCLECYIKDAERRDWLEILNFGTRLLKP